MAVSPLRKEQTADQESGLTARRAIRAGAHRGPTAGLAPGNVQGNLAILPQALAADFLRFCQINPKPCPLIGTSAPGDPRVPELGEDLDIRTDLPRYRVWKNGELVAEPEDIREFWRDDLVSFVIGCSFSFEEALAAEGIELRHITRGCLDVMVDEPPSKDNPLLNVENITITPHTAGPTWENWPKAFRNAFDNILRVHAGRKPMWVIPELRHLV